MNHWKETAEILGRLAELTATGGRAALATVVSISGSAYRRPGAKFLIEETGSTLGSVSGGCLEADVRDVALSGVLASGSPSLRHYSTGGDDDAVWGLGLGCNGMVDVFVQPATEGSLAALAERLRELLTGDAPVAIATLVDSSGGGDGAGDLGATLLLEPGGAVRGSLGSSELDRLAAAAARALLPGGRSGVHKIGGRRVFVEVLPPPPHLVVCGAGEDARPLVAYAADSGFRVTVFDHRPALLVRAHFPQAARLVLARPGNPEANASLPPAERSLAVVKTHSLAIDREWVRFLLASGVPYVGVLGPRERTEGILKDIDETGETGARSAGRVYGPVGLDLGADGPRQVAVSIVAELLAVTAGREPRHLYERKEAIHAGPVL
jgi:xanthine/CO dehydrogenase XdhC/CoxF family maturation factor